MKVLKTVLPLVAVLFFSHCSDDTVQFSQQSDYLIFGHFYGECFGESCVEIFKITDGKVFEDTLDRYPSASNLPNPTSFVQLSNDNFEQAKFITGRIPAKLFEENETVIGQPDAGDWGGFYAETNVSGVQRYWLIDKMESNLPAYLHDFTASLNEAIQKLTSP